MEVTQKNLEEFKKKVLICLRGNRDYTSQADLNLMKLYEDDFPEFLRDNWTPAGAAGLMSMHG